MMAPGSFSDMYIFPTQYDVGVDNNNFTPVSFAQVKMIIEKQIEQSERGEL